MSEEQKRGRRITDQTDEVYGALTVVARADRPKGTVSKRYSKCSWWLCKCECGNEVVKPIDYMRNASHPNCGCGAGRLRPGRKPMVSREAHTQMLIYNGKRVMCDDSKVIKGLMRNDTACAECGKVFDRYAGKDWGYKRQTTKGHTKYFCSYSCTRKWDSKHQRALWTKDFL